MKTRILFLILAMIFCGKSIAQNDSVDVIHYQLTLDINHNTYRTIEGSANISVQMLRPCNQLTFDLMQADVDSIKINGEPAQFTYANNQIAIPISNPVVTHIDTISIYYSTRGYVEGYGWGGFHMDNKINYNLGVTFDLQPHNFGRAWYPCRDNFTDKATYSMTVTTKNGWRAVASGLKVSEVFNEDGSSTSRWDLNHPTPTYLYSVATGDFKFIERTYQGYYATYPALLAFVENDSAQVAHAFEIMEPVIPQFEYLYGPYRWDRIGYVATPMGSMEHISNIGLVSSCMGVRSESCQGVKIHEFAHSWFGNLVTCASSEDMWFNEGGATFCEEVGFEKAYDKEYANRYYTTKLENVIRTNHHIEGEYLALHGMQYPNVYGGTTYNKGAVVWHSLRGYLGDSVFYHAMKRLFDNHTYGNVSAPQFCDSLSLYTGIDLTPFFNFHIYNPGFVDYVIDSIWTENSQTHITIHQQLLGAPNFAEGNRVPVTFFSYNRQQSSEQMITFDGESTTATFSLPFVPSYAILDYHQTLSDAVTDEEDSIKASASTTLKNAHLKIENNSNTKYYIHVAHHWTAPKSAPQQGIVRTANRFWEINTDASADPNVKVSFRYSRGDQPSVAKYLDYGFYMNETTIDSIGVLYRPSPSEPWQLMTRQHDKNINVGYFTLSGLQSGQYTLAVIDPKLLSVQSPTQQLNFIYPNPSHGTFKVNAPSNHCTLTILNLAGQVVACIPNVTDTISLTHLPQATYVAQLTHRNGKIITTQKIIIQ